MTSAFDIRKIRQETPGCGDKLFFNSAGSSLPPAAVTAKMLEYLRQEELIGGYAQDASRSDELQEVYLELARLINGQPHQIAITFNATDSFARALSAIPFRKGDTILTTTEDYVSNQIQFLSLQKRLGIEVKRVPGKVNGDLDLEQFEEMVKSIRPKLVSVTHVPTSSGLIQDVERVGEILSTYDDCYYLVDACQSVGQLDVDVKRIGCDFLSVTGRKFLRGPRGTGFLYLSDKVLNEGLTPLLPDLRGAEWTEEDEYRTQPDARRFEMWEFQYATILGLKEAAKYANKIGMEAIEAYNMNISERLRQGLHQINGVRVLDQGSRLGSIITLRKEGLDQNELAELLDRHQVYYSIGRKPNALLDFRRKGVDWALRLSPHYFNTEEEVNQLLEIIESL